MSPTEKVGKAGKAQKAIVKRAKKAKETAKIQKLTLVSRKAETPEKEKAVVTKWTVQQRATLERRYLRNTNPSPELRAKWARDMNVTEKGMKNWWDEARRRTAGSREKRKAFVKGEAKKPIQSGPEVPVSDNGSSQKGKALVKAAAKKAVQSAPEVPVSDNSSSRKGKALVKAAAKKAVQSAPEVPVSDNSSSRKGKALVKAAAKKAIQSAPKVPVSDNSSSQKRKALVEAAAGKAIQSAPKVPAWFSDTEADEWPGSDSSSDDDEPSMSRQAKFELGKKEVKVMYDQYLAKSADYQTQLDNVNVKVQESNEQFEQQRGRGEVFGEKQFAEFQLQNETLQAEHRQIVAKFAALTANMVRLNVKWQALRKLELKIGREAGNT